MKDFNPTRFVFEIRNLNFINLYEMREGTLFINEVEWELEASPEIYLLAIEYARGKWFDEKHRYGTHDAT